MRIFPILVCGCFLILAGCSGSSSSGTLDDPAQEQQSPAAGQQGRIEIPVGSPVARVLKALGPADSTQTADDGREIWRYNYRRAEYIYASNSGNVQTLVLSNYIASPQPESPGQTLLLTIVFDQAKKVADFNFSLMAY